MKRHVPDHETEGILMCDVCGYRYCPPACPEYRGVSAEFGMPMGRCARCGGYVYRSEAISVRADRLICGECAAMQGRRADPFLSPRFFKNGADIARVRPRDSGETACADCPRGHGSAVQPPLWCESLPF